MADLSFQNIHPLRFARHPFDSLINPQGAVVQTTLACPDFAKEFPKAELRMSFGSSRDRAAAPCSQSTRAIPPRLRSTASTGASSVRRDVPCEARNGGPGRFFEVCQRSPYQASGGTLFLSLLSASIPRGSPPRCRVALRPAPAVGGFPQRMGDGGAGTPWRCRAERGASRR